MQISNAAAAAVNAATALMNAGSPPGLLNIFDGTLPATTATANSGNLLCQITLSNTAFPGATNGVSNQTNFAANTNIAANGTANYYRFTDSANNVVAQGSIGVNSGDIRVNSQAFTAGASFAMTYISITQPLGT